MHVAIHQKENREISGQDQVSYTHLHELIEAVEGFATRLADGEVGLQGLPQFVLGQLPRLGAVQRLVQAAEQGLQLLLQCASSTTAFMDRIQI